ncbi:MAG: ABC transporter permease [Bacteroidetes bacterium]|nr:ABC transporter permease [Bacteroidota bacterium]
MNLPIKIAFRYFFSRRREGSFNIITLISGISLLGYVVGAAALVIVLSVFNGFENLFSTLYSQFDADIQITSTVGKSFPTSHLNIAQIKNIDGVLHVNYVIEENVLARYNGKQVLATVKGVDETYLNAVHLDTNLVSGALLLQEGDTNFALIGQGLAYQLGVQPDDQFNFLTIYVPAKGNIDLLNAENAFKRNPIFPIGVLSIQEEVDSKYIIVPLRFIEPLLDKKNQVSALEIRLNKDASMDKIRKQIEDIAGNSFLVKNRFQQRDSFYKVMKSEKFISFMILLFIMMVAAFNTVGSLYMLVIEKKKDLKIFASIGLTANQAKKIFMFEGIILAIFGGLIGILLGGVICWLQQEYSIINFSSSEGFIIDSYPVRIKAIDFLYVFLTIVGLGFITSLYPAYKAKQMIQ